ESPGFRFASSGLRDPRAGAGGGAKLTSGGNSSDNKREAGDMAKFGIGQAVRRGGGQRVLPGRRGRSAGHTPPRQYPRGLTVLSPHAHARIKRLDTAKAKAAPGVLCVLTGADAVAEKLGSFTAHLMPEDFGAPKGHRTFQPVLTADKARFVGDRVAFVVAET